MRPAGPVPRDGRRDPPRGPSRACGREAWRRRREAPACARRRLRPPVDAAVRPRRPTSNVTSGDPTGTSSPDRRVERGDPPRERRGDLDRRLRRLDLDEGLVQLDRRRLRRRATRRSRLPRVLRRGRASRTRARAISTPPPRGRRRRSARRSAGTDPRATPAGTARPSRSPSRRARPGESNASSIDAGRDLGAEPERLRRLVHDDDAAGLARRSARAGRGPAARASAGRRPAPSMPSSASASAASRLRATMAP